MFLRFEDRPSDSPYIERVWRGFGGEGGSFVSVAAGHVEIVVTRVPNFTMVTVRGPETRATTIDCPPDGEWAAIKFRAGVHLPSLPTHQLVDRRDVDLPVADDGTFVLDGSRWQLPDLENAETYVARLASRGVIARDDMVEAAVRGGGQPLSVRSVQRRFRRTTGMTQGQFRQIQRARHATNLLREGAPILDAVHEAGYFDQAHLTRSLKAFIGATPASIARQETQLSFLYKTG